MILTSGDLFKAALRKCGGIIAEGETPSSELMEDIRIAFNTLLDSWSAERLSVFATQDQTLTWPAGSASRTLGPSGDLVGLRPIKLLDSTYFKDPSTVVSYDLTIVNEAAYNSIALKTSTSAYPQILRIEMTMPDATVYLYPVPTIAIEMHFISVIALTQVDNLTTDIVVPPGYLRALTFNLAAEICPELGIEPPATTQRIAMTSKRILKAQNAPMDVMSMPIPMVGRGNRFNIYSGE